MTYHPISICFAIMLMEKVQEINEEGKRRKKKKPTTKTRAKTDKYGKRIYGTNAVQQTNPITIWLLLDQCVLCVIAMDRLYGIVCWHGKRHNDKRQVKLKAKWKNKYGHQTYSNLFV